MSVIAILGRQPALGLAELESLLGSELITPIGHSGALIDIERDKLPLSRLGGTVKMAKLLTTLDTNSWQDIEDYLRSSLPHHLEYIPQGKIKLGLSTYGLDANPDQINRTTLSLKNVIKKSGRSARIISNKSQDLNTAQVIHGGLLTAVGIELVIIRDGSNTILAQTFWVQDIDAYAERDQKRPKRDARVGMLPPKLAQIIINLAIGKLESENGSSLVSNPKLQITVLDPFCGTGVILQEALLMGYSVYGSDIDQRMVEYTTINIKWLQDKYPDRKIYDDTHGALGWTVETGDATNHKWPAKTIVATETYLGRPFSSLPAESVLREAISNCNVIHKKFLKNLAAQMSPRSSACLAVPAWRTKNGVKHLPVLDSLEELGYNRHKFVHVDTKDLIYHRPQQIVARELVVLERR